MTYQKLLYQKKYQLQINYQTRYFVIADTSQITECDSRNIKRADDLLYKRSAEKNAKRLFSDNKYVKYTLLDPQG